MRKLLEYSLVIIIVLAVLGVFPIQFYAVTSGSMEPTIATGSVVLVNKTQKQVETGDVITFLSGQQAVTHRVIAVEATESGPLYTTQGDANNAIDPGQRTPDQIVGKVLFGIPLIGTLILFVQNHLWTLVGISLVGYGIIVFFKKGQQKKQIQNMEELL
ncbi:MAG: signal peptidase I [Culicoidibacterales bacterium]